jgi:hypothetical protein
VSAFGKMVVDYPIHGFGVWGCVFVVYYPMVGPKGPALVIFLIIKRNAIYTNHVNSHKFITINKLRCFKFSSNTRKI